MTASRVSAASGRSATSALPSRASRPPRHPVPVAALLLAAALVPFGAAPAAAQQERSAVGAPVPLGPPQSLQPRPVAPPPETGQPPATPPAVTPAPAGEAVPEEGAAPPPPAGSEAGIRVDTLGGVDPDTAGTLTEDQGGFGVDMWAGTSRATVDALLPRLPVNAASAAMRDLMRRLLLSSAAVPKGQGADPGSLVALRIHLLAAMGDLDGVNGLLGATPRRNQHDALMQAEADTRFLANDNARACSLAAGQIRHHGNPYWQKAFIFCQALAGQTAEANLGVSLLHEMDVKDPAFFTLIDALTGGTVPTLKSLPNPTPLHLAMARAAKAKLPADVVSSNRPAILRTIATNPNAAVDLRLEAAERAEAAGALAPEALRQLYASIPFTEEELANPLSKAEAESGPVSRALLYRTALIQTVPTAQAEAIARAFSLAREGGRYAATVRVFMPLLRRVPPSSELLWFAPEAARALLVSGEVEAASAWLSALQAGAMFDAKARAAMTAVLPVARLAGAEEAQHWTPLQLGDWWQGVKDADNARERASLLFSLLDGLGDSIPDAAWEPLLGGPASVTAVMPHPALWYRLASAADNGRKGETVLLALLAIGEGGPGQADPVVLHRVLHSLAAVGLEKEARQLAVEAAVALDL